MKIENSITTSSLVPGVMRLFELASEKTLRLAERWNPKDGAPVVTRAGKYSSRNWTQWTQGLCLRQRHTLFRTDCGSKAA